MKRLILATVFFAGTAWADNYIIRDPSGNAIGHVNKSLENPLLAPKGGKKWYTPATVIKPPLDPKTQVRTGPVYDVNAGTITWTVRDKTAGELDAEKNARVDSEMGDPSREALVDVVFEMEKRLAVLENKAAPTRDVVRAKVRALIKSRLP